MNPYCWELHQDDIYSGLLIDDHTRPAIQGWNGTSKILSNKIYELKPKLAVEVGSWKGQSAVNIGSALHTYGGTLICVDTFTGAREMWRAVNPVPMEKLRGRPTIYDQFIQNIAQHGLQDTVVPLPLPSQLAVKVLADRGWRPEYIYIDANHDYDDVLADLTVWYDLLLPGGILLGDDYKEDEWKGVKQAVDEFIAAKNLRLNYEHPTFWFRKP